MSKLMTFVKPKPNKMMISLLEPLNNYGFLMGVPLLNKIPLIKNIPLIGKGLCHINKFTYHENTINNIKSIDKYISFVGPNHPEFFTDWMLDKYIIGSHFKLMASWATHNIINGMGDMMQKFWLSNNLIAQIPKSDNAEGKAYSIEVALSGNPVLLHPEGMVHWSSDHISPIYNGIIDFAIQAHEKKNIDKDVVIFNPTWKLVFNNDIEKLINKEIDAIAKELKIHIKNIDTSSKFFELHIKNIQRLSTKYNIPYIESFDFTHLKSNFIKNSLLKISEYVECSYNNSLTLQENFKLISHQYKKDKEIKQFNIDSYPISKLLHDIEQLFKFNETYYKKNYLTQEHLAESLQRFRISFCNKGLKNKFHKFIPIPLSHRTCHVLCEEPINISQILKINPNIDKLQIKEIVQTQMQKNIDKINLLYEYKFKKYQSFF